MDIGKKEQIAFSMRYVDQDFNINEHFYGFYDTETTKSEALFNKLKEILNKLNLSLSNVVGQCYDGAANMSGCKKGLSTLVLKENKKALYQHCAGHRLNLGLKDASKKEPDVLSTINIVNLTFDFVEGSAQRHALFQQIQGDDGKTLKHLCETRWGDRALAFRDLVETYKYVLLFLEVS